MSADPTAEAAIEPVAEVVITVGRDGRVYFHDLGPALLPVAQALAPGDLQLRERAKVVQDLKDSRNESSGDQS